MRPFALLPGDAGAYAWWAVCLVALGGTVVALIRAKPITTSVAVIALSIPIAYEIGVGNLNAVVLALLVAGWYFYARGREAATGALFAAATALKVTPGIMLWWLVTQRRWEGARAFVFAGLAFAALSILGAGLSAHLEYLGIVRQTSTAGSSDLSAAGIARFVGVQAEIASVIPIALLGIGFVAVWALRARPGLAYAASITTMLAGSPVVNINWFTLLLALLAPIAWPVRRPAQAHVATESSADASHLREGARG
jgi:hypothetical protein